MSIRDRMKEIKPFRSKQVICVLENPELHVNLGTVVRNVSAFGISRVYVIGGFQETLKDFETSRTDKTLLKSSVGASKWVFIKHFETTSACLEHLKKNGFTSFVTSPHVLGKVNIDLYEGNFTQPKLAIWFGNETEGISEEAVDGSSGCIQIPMAGVVESLNLGTSTGIVLSFIRKQRLDFIHKVLKKRSEKKIMSLSEQKIHQPNESKNINQ